MGPLRRAAETRVDHQQMAYHPCDLGPTLVVALDTEVVDVEVQVGLQVAGIHAREAPEVALDPGAEVVHERHRLQVGGVADIGLVALVHEAVLPDQHVVRPLTVVDEGGALRDVRPHRLPDPGGRGLAVPAYHRDGLLAGVDPDRDADLLLGEAALAGLPVALREVRVVDVRLVDPRAAPQHDAVLVAVDGGEEPVAPLPGGLVGDAAQLPSVGPGNVLRELIQSGVVPVVQLKTVFRQAAGSSIAVNAQLIDQKETGLIFDDNFMLIPAKDQQEAMYLLCALYKRAVESVGVENVQILTPVRKEGHQCGVNNLNTAIQSIMQEAPGLGYHHYGRYYCVGDPVIQTRNAGGIYNGEIGVVTNVEEDKVFIRFAGYDNDLVYDDEKMGLLDLAYALTVHKAQGTECPVVIVPVLKEHSFMLTRNLIYTAITRGKSKVILIGNSWALERAIKKTDTSKRHTHLAARIQAGLNRLLEAEKNVAA